MKGFEEERENKIKLLRKGLIIVGVLLLIFIIAFAALKVLDKNRDKIILDGREITSDRLTYNFGEETYVNLREMTKILPSFKYSTGEYLLNGNVNQDTNYMHIKSPYEVIQLQKESDKMVKFTLVKQNYYRYDVNGNMILTPEEERDGVKEIEIQDIDNKKRTSEEFTLSAETREMNNNQFVAIQDINYIFNLKYTKVGNSIYFESVEHLERNYAIALNRENLHLNPNYQNRRAIIDGYFISTTKPNDPDYGVYVYENGSFRSQISESYKDVRYVQSNKNLFVISQQDAFGLINIDKAADVIQPGSFEAIESYIPDRDLYIVTNIEGKKGVLDSSKDKAEPIVHVEYDEIGFNADNFPGISTGKIFFDSLIPARKNLRWYIFDLDNPGEIIGSKIGGYLDIGYRKPEVITVGNKNEVKFTEEQKADLEYRGFNDLTYFPSSATPEENLAKITRLNREGYVTNPNHIPEGESLLIVPDETGYGGLVVKSMLSGRYVYYIISSNPTTRRTALPYSPPYPYQRIYRLSEDGVMKYYAIGVDDNNTKYEVKRAVPETPPINENVEDIQDTNSDNVNQNQNQNQNDNNENMNTNINTDSNNNNQNTNMNQN